MLIYYYFYILLFNIIKVPKKNNLLLYFYNTRNISTGIFIDKKALPVPAPAIFSFDNI